MFLGYPPNHRGYKCFDLSTNKIYISRHVLFDESQFPFAKLHHPTPTTYTFLHENISPYFTLPLNQNNTTSSSTSPLRTDTTTPSPFGPQQPNDSFSPGPQQPAHTSTGLSQPIISGPAPQQPTTPATNTSQAPTISAMSRPTPIRNITTRSMHGISKPKTPFNLLSSITPYPLPKNPKEALSNPNWNNAMSDEFNALIQNKTWNLVPRTSNMNIIRSMWVFRLKKKSDGSFERHKARLVCDGRSQQIGIDCDETFSPVVKPATIRTVLSLALSHSWPIHQLDVKNAFLHGHLNETVYMHQPMGFRDKRYPDHVCLLKKSLYGLKQAPQAWYHRFTEFVSTIGFIHSKSNHSLFIYRNGNDIAYILLYVDDIILTASSTHLRESIMFLLANEFAMTDLGPLSYFLGISVTRHAGGLFLSQRTYAEDILKRTGMSSCNPVATPVDTKSKLGTSSGPPYDDSTHYRSLAGALHYLTFTRPDISYAVQQVCLHMHDPKIDHMNALKRILRYIRGTIEYGLHLYPSSSNKLVSFTDADWGGCPDTRRSTSGYCVYFGDNLISWSSKRQPTLPRSNAEAEYRGVANVDSESCCVTSQN